MRPKGPSALENKKWDATFALLVAFHAANGHCKVCKNVPENIKLAGWVKNQKREWRDRGSNSTRLTPQRVSRLNELGFEWELKRRRPNDKDANNEKWSEKWNEMYDRLKRYKTTHGNCEVPIAAYKEDLALGTWVSCQRGKRDTLRSDYKKKLDELGFVWFKDNWDTQYKLLVEYHRNHGHSDVPQRHKINDTALGSWVSKQRRFGKNGKLALERVAQLDQIDFDWESNIEKLDRHWNEMLCKLKKYKLENGNTIVPHYYKDRELGNWVIRQRGWYKKDLLRQDRIEKLDEVGFVWMILDRGEIDTSRYEDQWTEKYEQLKIFREEHGHFSVPASLYRPLNNWMSTQRAVYARGEMRKNRTRLLNDINFVWREGTQHRSQRIWDSMFELLKTFRNSHGHTYVERHHDLPLWRWTEKSIWKKSRATLSSEKDQLLQSIGFWDPPPPGAQQTRHRDPDLIASIDANGGGSESAFSGSDPPPSVASEHPSPVYCIGTKVRKVCTYFDTLKSSVVASVQVPAFVLTY